MKTYWRLLKYVKPYVLYLALAMVGGIGVGLFSGWLAFLVKDIFDVVLQPDQPPVSFMDPDLYIIPGKIILAYLGKGVCVYLSFYFMSYVSQHVIMDLRNELYEKIIFQSLAFFADKPTGILMSRVTYDIENVQNSVSTTLGDIIRDGATIIVLTGVVFYMDWRLACVSIVIAPIVTFFIVRFGKKLRETSRKSQEKMAAISTILFETITGNRIVKAFSMENREIRKFMQATAHFCKVNLRNIRISAISSPFMELMGGVGAAIVLIYGRTRISGGKMTVGDLVAFLTALFLMYEPLKKLSRVNAAMQQGMAAMTRIQEVMDEPNQVQEAPDAVAIEGTKHDIVFEHVYFRYDQKDVLHDINLRIKAGEIVAVVGASGSGKSTLANLIPRFYDPVRGRITIGDWDIRHLQLKSLRSLIGIVTQETILFNDTVRNNIRYGSHQISNEEIMAAAKAAYAHDFIMELPKGYDTHIGEKGLTLSGGQRQRLAIARAILKNPAILILDEATSALDTESEILVQNALENLMVARTTLVIAHRLSTIRKADRIIVLESGRIEEEGKHTELLAIEGVYCKLCESQYFLSIDQDNRMTYDSPEKKKSRS